MKKAILLPTTTTRNISIYRLLAVIIVLSSITFHSYSAVLIVDNSSVSPGVYSSIADAHAAAQPGDTLHIQPSGASYGIITVTKKIHILGPGHSLSWTSMIPEFESVTFNAGSGESTIEGVVVNNRVSISIGVTDITIRNCRFTNNTMKVNTTGNTHNLLIEGNVFQAHTSSGAIINLNTSIENVLIKNNFFRINSTNENATLIGSPNPSLVFDHNTIIITNKGRYCIQATGTSVIPCVSGHQISNNIWLGQERNMNYWIGASTFLNNMTYSSEFTYDALSGENNLNNVLPVFVNAETPYNWSVNLDYNLAPANEGFNGSTGENQIGVYGGGFTFQKRGQPKGIPTLEQVYLLNSTVPQNGDIQIKIRARKGMQ